MHMTFTKNDKTILDFLKELKLVAEYFNWTKPRVRKFHVIRGYAKDRVFCPLAAVAYALYGVKLGCDEIAKICKAINIPLELGLMIAKAADGGAAFDGETDSLHEKLLKAVGV